MSEIAFLLRLGTFTDKEFRVTPVAVTGTTESGEQGDLRIFEGA